MCCRQRDLPCPGSSRARNYDFAVNCGRSGRRVLDEEHTPPLSPLSTAEPAAPAARLPYHGFAFYLSAALCAVFMVRVLGSDWNTHFRATWPDALFPKQGYL